MSNITPGHLWNFSPKQFREGELRGREREPVALGTWAGTGGVGSRHQAWLTGLLRTNHVAHVKMVAFSLLFVFLCLVFFSCVAWATVWEDEQGLSSHYEAFCRSKKHWVCVFWGGSESVFWSRMGAAIEDRVGMELMMTIIMWPVIAELKMY